MPKTVVVIHGVGNTAPAELGSVVATNLGFEIARQSTIYAGGQALLQFEDDDSGDSVIEVTWSELLRPKSTVSGVLCHIIYIVTSMLDVATRDLQANPKPLFIRLYRWALLTITPGAVLYLLSTAIAVSVVSDARRWIFLFAIMIISIIITAWLSRLGKHFRWLWAWVAIVPVVWLAAALQPLPADHNLVFLSGKVRAFGFLGVIALLFLAAGETWVRWRKHRLETRLTHLAFLYVPFIAMNALNTWLTFLCLSFLSGDPNYDRWEVGVLGDLEEMPGGRMALLEAAATMVFGGIGILSLTLPVIGYLVGAGPQGDPPRMNRRGRGAQNGMAVFLALAPITLILLLVLYALVTFADRDAIARSLGLLGIKSDIKILEIYRTSVLRTLPYLVWLVGPFALVLDVLGDVLFYLQPNERHPAAIARRCKGRLRAALDLAGRNSGDDHSREFVVLAHSQGSIIASDLRADGLLSYPLVTAGSPVDSLYARFLGVERDANPANVGVSWVNCFRESDVIAGPIERPEVENEHVGPGGHTGYWSDPKLAEIICELANGGPPRMGPS